MCAALFALSGVLLALFVAALTPLTETPRISAWLRACPLTYLLQFVLCLRYILIWSVKVYQAYAKAETRIRCCFTPSCSDYAILAIKKYGAVIGGIKTISRLQRCHAPNGGEDYP